MSQKTTPVSDKLWGGRFERPPNELFYEFQRSFPFDRRLLPYELAVDRAWARAIQHAGILTAAEVEQTLSALDAIAKRAAAEPALIGCVYGLKTCTTLWRQRWWGELGPVGFKLHTARQPQ